MLPVFHQLIIRRGYMLDYRHHEIRSRLLQGKFGLEKESLRLTLDGHNAKTPHPFHDPHIVCDFAENQTEINTPVCDTVQEAVQSLRDLSVYMDVYLYDQNELIWPFSSPGYISSEEDIPVAQMQEHPESHEYREYLSGRYGRYRMAFSGIHFNFSFSDSLLAAQARLDQAEDFDSWKNHFYLQLAQKAANYGWVINALLSASPLVDGSFWQKHLHNSTCFTGMASLRCSELGYWNFFTPVFQYDTMDSYTRSIETYCEQGLLKAPSELYYPVRIKPASRYSMENLRSMGADHIELRMIDLNPYEIGGITMDDARFCHLFLVYLACRPDLHLSQAQQILAVQNFKNAARYDLKSVHMSSDQKESTTMWQKTMDFLEEMNAFYQKFDPQLCSVIEAQKRKLNDPDHFRLAWKVRQDFQDGYMEKGLQHAGTLQLQAVEAVKQN